MLRKVIVPMTSLFILVSCASNQLQSKAVEANQTINETCGLLLTLEPEEANAWLETRPKANKCQKGYQEPFNPSDAVAIGQCGEDAMNEYIRPYVSSKSRFDRLVKERRKEYQDYADGTISWDRMNKKSKKRLHNYLKASDLSGNGSYFTYSQCHNAIVQEQIFPVYPNNLKPILNEYMVDVSAFSRKADKSRMAQEDYMIGKQKLWTQFTKKEQYQIDEINKQGQPWANAITAMNNEYQRQEKHQAEVNALNRTNNNQPTITNTDCNVRNNKVNCTTW